MVKVQSIMDKLNNDPAELKKFHEDPTGYLKKEGLELPESAQKQLLEHVKKNPGAKPTWNVGCESNNS
jgi:hypothetical protein